MYKERGTGKLEFPLHWFRCFEDETNQSRITGDKRTTTLFTTVLLNSKVNVCGAIRLVLKYQTVNLLR